jgi:hypothetical protein
LDANLAFILLNFAADDKGTLGVLDAIGVIVLGA